VTRHSCLWLAGHCDGPMHTAGRHAAPGGRRHLPDRRPIPRIIMARKRTPPPGSPTPESADAIRRDVRRLLSRQEFGSIDDVNAFLQQMMAQPIPVVEPASDRERAEDLVLAARSERVASRRRRLITDALALDADCIPAHLALAEEAKSPAEAIQHARQAIAAGERALGTLVSDSDAFLWGDPIGRSWLIARGLLANFAGSAAIARKPSHMRVKCCD
jgi:hypothetical protein